MGPMIVCMRARRIGEKPIRLEQPDAEQEPSAPPPQRIREAPVAAARRDLQAAQRRRPLKLFQERGEMFRDGVVDRIVPGPEHLPDFPQPWASAQDVARFG
jgi:hypothetical protein